MHKGAKETPGSNTEKHKGKRETTTTTTTIIIVTLLPHVNFFPINYK